MFMLNNGAFCWESRKQDTNANSKTEAEYIAALEAARKAVWIRSFITGLMRNSKPV